MDKKLYVADLFAGGGGLSTGMARAVAKMEGIKEIDLLAINHWDRALNSHQQNHPWARHICQAVEACNPREVVPGGYLDLLMAGVECIHHSRARGGKPVDDQRRSSAWQVLRWAEHLDIRRILIENVSEFQEWGPLGPDNKPDKARKGETFNAFIAALRSLGYTLDHKVLNAADYGAHTSRRRLFIMAVKGHGPIVWPAQTHSRVSKKTGQPSVPGTQPWRGARHIIDWTIRGKSIFERKKPLSAKTMARIIKGLERYGGPEMQPFIVKLRGTSHSSSIEEPAPTITAGGTHLALAEPKAFTLAMGSEGAPRSVDEPLPTVVARGGGFVAEPFVVDSIGSKDVWDARIKSVDDPLGSITAQGRFGVAEPFIMATGGRQSTSPAKSVEDPLPTVMPNHRLNVFEPFILPNDGPYNNGTTNPPKSIDEPLNTITSRGGGHIIQPFITPNFGEAKGQEERTHSVDDPLPAVTSRGAGNLIEPVIVEYYGNGDCHPTSDPLPTITTRDRFGLVEPRPVGPIEVGGKRLDILFRMLQPHELSAAQGFPKGYQFEGTRSDAIRMIGNAVVVEMGEALTSSLLKVGA